MAGKINPRPSPRHRAPLLWVLLPLILGITAGDLGWRPDPLAALAAAAVASGVAGLCWPLAKADPPNDPGLLLPRAKWAPQPTRITWSRFLGLPRPSVAPPPTIFGGRKLFPAPARPPGGLGRAWVSWTARRVWGAALLYAMACAGGLVGERLRLDPIALPKKGALTRVVLHIEHATRVSGKRPGMSGWGIVSAGDDRVRGERIYFFALTQGDAPLPLRAGTLALSGALKAVPSRGGPGSFNGFLRSLGIRAELSPAWPRGAPAEPAGYSAFRERLADRMAAILALGFDRRPDLAAVYRAMMLGRKSGLTAVQKARFIRSGTMHLFAINGLHIGIVALAAHALLLLLRCPRPLAALAVLALLWLDVDSTGASPSAVRAFTMVAVLETGNVCWLPANPLAALAFAACLLLAVDPRGAFSASFQMSFGVVAALITLGAPLAAHFQRHMRLLLPPDRPFPPLAWLAAHLAEAAGFGAAAAAVSAITGIAYFGTFAPIGLLANLLLMPLATLVIIAGFASIVGGLAHLFFLSRLFNAAARLLLEAITRGVAALADVPLGSFTGHYRIDGIGPAALAALLAACLWGYAHQWAREAGGFLPPFVIAAVTLLLGVSYASAILPP